MHPIHLPLLLHIALAALLVNNIVFARALGICSMSSFTRTYRGAAAVGLCMTFLMGLGAAFAWFDDIFILVPFDWTAYRTITFVLSIFFLAQLSDIALRRFAPVISAPFRTYLPSLSANCAIIAVILINAGTNPFTGSAYTFIEAVMNGILNGAGFCLALIVMTGIRERVETSFGWASLAGWPITLISAGCVGLAMFGFAGR
jgi:Na+-translocating ferredoxin:NAD+ oxidoreductase subunit A